jgi:hypothetical protein
MRMGCRVAVEGARVGWLSPLLVLGQSGGGAHAPHFFFQPRQLKLFLPQNLVNILHASAPGNPIEIGTIKSNFISCLGFVKN